MEEPYDVAIVGYGPVGQTLAILLGQRGWRVGVFEKRPAAYPLPRAVHFDHEVARILQAAGSARSCRDSVSRPTSTSGATPPVRRCCASARRGRALRLAGGEHVLRSPISSALLDRRARALPSVEVMRGCEVVGLRAAAPTASSSCSTIARRPARGLDAR